MTPLPAPATPAFSLTGLASQPSAAAPQAASAGSILPSGAATRPATETQKARVATAAKSFEAQFLSVMMGQMFEGVETKGFFGGGAGENAFKSFMTDAFSKAVADHGGLGLAKEVSRDMLKMQGLS